MPKLNELLELAKFIASRAGKRLDSFHKNQKNYIQCWDLPKEIKAVADTVLERDILEALVPVGLPILSEEAGYIAGRNESTYWFIVDPLDGTFNFVKGLGPCAVSIALWSDRRPIFGVIYCLMDHRLFWGGAGMGAYADGEPIRVSDTSNLAQASICTGFPVRLEIANGVVMQNFWRMVTPYAKVRMLGSAAVSLVSVARGSADVYSEQNIMLWDVAGGLSIVEGAGGCVHCVPGTIEHSVDVYASNRLLAGESIFGR